MAGGKHAPCHFTAHRSHFGNSLEQPLLAEDILTAAEIEVIVKNYKEGGSVRQLARQFWQAQEEMRASDAFARPVMFLGVQFVPEVGRV